MVDLSSDKTHSPAVLAVDDGARDQISHSIREVCAHPKGNKTTRDNFEDKLSTDTTGCQWRR